MSTAKIETVAWLAIYLGMVLIGLGLSLQRNDAGFGGAVATAGTVGVVAGMVLIWWRSRIKRDA